MSEIKKMGPDNLAEVWGRVAQYVKKITGDVNVPQDGNLLEQIQNLGEAMGNPQPKTETLDVADAASETDTLPLYVTGEGKSKQISLAVLAESLNIQKFELYVHTCAGAKVTCSNGVATMENTGSCKFNIPDTGIWTVTCSMNGVSVSKTVEIYSNPRTDIFLMILDTIAVTTPPTKVEYDFGDVIDPTGAVVTATYMDGTTEIVTDDCQWDTTAMKADTTVATVSYTLLGVTRTATTPITVHNRMQSISVTTAPTKTKYLKGDTFDATGMVVKATYADGSSKTITGYTYSPTGALTNETAITISYTEDGVTKTTTQSIIVKEANIYGVSWDGTSTTAWTRTDDAADFVDPVPYVSGATSYGSPFDNLQPWAGMVKSERTGGTMVAIPKFWYKLTQNGNGIKIQIADRAATGFSVSPAHMDRGDGKGERDVVYVGRYHCGSSTYKSVSGAVKNNITRSSARSAIHNLGSNIWQFDYAMWFTIQLLYLVEFADWNSQAKIGYGCGNGSAAQSMGASDSMPYHTGTMQSSRTAYGVGVQYRNIEDLWGNVYDWLDGCYYNSNGLNIILNPNKFSDSANGVAVGVPSNGYPSKFAVKTDGPFPVFIPTEANGSTSSYSCDNWNFVSSSPCLFVGGSYYQYLNYGMFYVFYGSASDSFSDIGCRLQELP